MLKFGTESKLQEHMQRLGLQSEPMCYCWGGEKHAHIIGIIQGSWIHIWSPN